MKQVGIVQGESVVNLSNMNKITALMLLACATAYVNCDKEKKKDDKKDSVGTVVGIDLGTTYSV